MNQYDAEHALDLLSSQTEQLMAQEYAKSRTAIKNKMAELYEKYGDEGTLTFSEMSKANRMQQLTDFIDSEMERLTGVVNAQIEFFTKEAYSQSYYNYTSVINEQAGMSLSWGVLNPDMIASIVNEPSVSGMSLGDILDKNRYLSLLEERQVITQGLIQGDSFQEMARRISQSFDKIFSDALRIARTEGTRAAGEGQALAYDRAEEMGIELKRIWSASATGDARHYNWGWNKAVADKDGYFTFTHSAGKGGVVTRSAKSPGKFGIASWDINCFPESVYIDYNSKIDKLYKRYFEGDLYTITTAGGNKITGTPNHPILTDKGFIPFNQVNNSTNLVCTRRNIKGFSLAPDVNNSPIVIAEIFDFINVWFPSQRETSINQNFHGDRFDSDVDIININSLLRDRIKPFLFKRFNKFILKFSNFAKRFLNTDSAFNFSRLWLFTASQSIVSFLSQSSSFLRGCLFHSYIHGFALITRLVSNFLECLINRIPAISKYFGYFFYRFTGFVFFDKPVSVKVNSFHGYVYNLQTRNNKYFVTDNIQNGNGNVNYFIVHNCRCRIRSEVILPEE